MSDENKVEKYDPSKLIEGVKDRIKAEFVGLIPDENWTEMVDKEVKTFFARTKQQYGNGFDESPFGVLVGGCIQEKAKEAIGKELSKKKYDVFWVGIDKEIDKELMDAITKRTPEIMANMIKGLVASAIEQMKTQQQFIG